MKKNNEFADFILYDVLGHIDGITAKKMFSGYGIFLHKKIIAIIADGELYFKADAKLKEKYKSLGQYPFTYDREGKTIEMSYMSVSGKELENCEAISMRVDESFGVIKVK